MREANYGDYIALHHAMITCHALALNAAGLIPASEIAAVYRNYAERMEDDYSRAELLNSAEVLEGLEDEAQTTPRWTPKVVPGGKDGGGEDGGGEAS